MCKEKIIEKITKMLEKTEQNGASASEAASAIAMAHNLMAKYGIEVSDLELSEKEEIITDDVDCGTKSVSSLQATLALSLAKHFGCEVVIHNKFNSKNLRFVGEKEKVEVVKTTFLFAYSVFKKSWEHYMKRLDMTTQQKNLVRGSFFKGFVDGITNELIKQENEFGLVVVKSDALKEYMANMQKGRTRQVSVRDRRDSDAYSKGYQEGASANRIKHKRIDE